MRDWTLSRIVWVADRGFSCDANRRYLRRGDHHYIIGEKLRSDSPQITVALSRQGRYRAVAANMRIKEVKISGRWLLHACGVLSACRRCRVT